MKLTLGMAHYEDYCGVWETVQGIRNTYYRNPLLREVEILYVDNSPGKSQSNLLAETQRNWWSGRQPDVAGIRRVECPYPVGPANAKDQVFRQAQGEIVVCVDSHVFLPPGSLEAIIRFFEQPSHAHDLLTGPMVYDNCQSISTDLADRWRGGSWGTWNTDLRGIDPDGHPFVIWGQGCGLFAMRNENWVGFNPAFRGFGSEEGYLHEKVRRRGGHVWCHPAVRWMHRFAKPFGQQSPVNGWLKCRNYVLGLTELGIPLDRCYRHFVEGIAEAGQGEPEKREKPIMDQAGWDMLMQNPANPMEWPTGQQPPAAFAKPGDAAPKVTVNVPFKFAAQLGDETPPEKKCGQCDAETQALTSYTLDKLYERARDTTSDINQHAPLLRELASQSKVVSEFGSRLGVSTVALLHGQPEVLITHDIGSPSGMVKILQERAGKTQFEFRQVDSRAAQPIECDLLFIDTVHTADHLWQELNRHAPLCRRWIALHDTEIFGETGEGGVPGILYAVRKFLREHPEWSVWKEYENNHGFMVLTCDPRDKPELPNTGRMAVNYAGALVRMGLAKLTGKHVLADEAVVGARLDTCAICVHRNGERCSKCGCFLIEFPDGRPGKALLATEDCPRGKWAAAEAKLKEASK